MKGALKMRGSTEEIDHFVGLIYTQTDFFYPPSNFRGLKRQRAC